MKLLQQGALEGLLLCGKVIVPSLFPFFVLGALYAALPKRQGKGLLCRALFGLPGAAGGAILLGLLGGYPMGAKTAAQLFETGALNQNEARRLQLFCVNAGPAFLLGAMATLTGSRQSGVVIFIAMTVSALILGAFTRVFSTDNEPSASARYTPETRQPFDKLLLSSVTQATAGILHVCAWVVLFSALCALLKHLPVGLWSTIPLLNVLLEVSGGAAGIVGAGLPLPVLCAALGWGGLGVHCQILGDLRKTGLPLRMFWVFRVLHALLAAGLCFLFTQWFPAAETASLSLGGRPVELFAVSLPAAAALLFFCAFMIFDLRLPELPRRKK